MKKLLYFSILIITYFSAAANDYPEYGTFEQADFDISEYADDPDADAIILFDIGKTDFMRGADGLDIRFKRHIRIKILKESGIEQANIALKYYANGFGKTESIDRIQASSNSLNEYEIETVELTKDYVFDEKINEYWRVKRFSIPGVKVGSVIEYQYEHITPFMFNLPDWEFQSDIPALKSRYEVKMVPFYEYVVMKQGAESLKYDSYIDNSFGRSYAGVDFQEMIHIYEMKDIPAFYDDEYITSRNDYIRKLDFQLSQINSPTGGKTQVIPSWEKLVDELQSSDDFGRYIKSAAKSTAQIIPSLNLDGKSDIEKIEIISNYMTNRFHFNDFYGKYASQKVKEFEKTNIGSAADLNLYLVGLLRAAGLQADPIILSTRHHGKVYKEYPIANRFNYAIAVVSLGEDQFIMLDATQPKLPYYLLPMRCINDFGLLINKNPVWINLGSSFYSHRTQISTIQLTGDSLVIRSQEKSTGYDAYVQRKACLQNESDFIQSKLNETEKLTKDPKITNLEEFSQSFLVDFSRTSTKEVFDSETYVSPFRNIEFSKNPLKQKKRDYPVDIIYKRDRTLLSTIYLPEGIKIKSLPENVSIENDLLSLNYVVKKMSNAVVFEANYKLKKSIYPPNEYEDLKQNFEILHKTLSKQLVLQSN